MMKPSLAKVKLNKIGRGHPHEYINLGTAKKVYVALTIEKAERDTVRTEDGINAEFLYIGNPKNASGMVLDSYRHSQDRVKCRLLGGKKAREVGIRPLVGALEVVRERIEVVIGLGINSIRCNLGQAGIHQDWMCRCAHMFATEFMPNFT